MNECKQSHTTITPVFTDEQRSLGQLCNTLKKRLKLSITFLSCQKRMCLNP